MIIRSINLLLFRMYRKFIYCWLLFWIVVIGALFVRDINMEGVAAFKKNFKKNQYHISYLYPLGRTSGTSNAQVIREEPIYFNVYSPLGYDRAIVSMTFDKPPTGWHFGFQTGPGFQYYLEPLQESVTQTIALEIKESHKENNTLRFMLAHPDHTNAIAPIALKEYSVTQIRDTEFSLKEYLFVWKQNIGATYERFF